MWKLYHTHMRVLDLVTKHHHAATCNRWKKRNNSFLSLRILHSKLYIFFILYYLLESWLFSTTHALQYVYACIWMRWWYAQIFQISYGIQWFEWATEYSAENQIPITVIKKRNKTSRERKTLVVMKDTNQILINFIYFSKKFIQFFVTMELEFFYPRYFLSFYLFEFYSAETSPYRCRLISMNAKYSSTEENVMKLLQKAARNNHSSASTSRICWF